MKLSQETFFAVIAGGDEKPKPKPKPKPTEDRPPLGDGEHDPMGGPLPGFPKPFKNPDEWGALPLVFLAGLAVVIFILVASNNNNQGGVYG